MLKIVLQAPEAATGQHRGLDLRRHSCRRRDRQQQHKNQRQHPFHSLT